jgi:hypothetical protein
VETKICSKCKEEKDVCEFYIAPNNQKYRASCKICFNSNAKKYRDCNKNKIKEYIKNYKFINKETIKEKSKLYREKNEKKIKEKQKSVSRKYYLNNREIVKERSKKFRKNNPTYSFEYREKNPTYSNDYQQNRKKYDPIFKIAHNMRVRMSVFIKSNNISKNNKTFDIVGCSPEFLKEHLEKQFTEGMCWELMGQHIHIDHIIPLSSANTEEEVYKLCHYTNLQPLWAFDNLSKGSKIL